MVMCAQVIMVQVSARVGSHKSIKRVGVDLLMVNSHRSTSQMMGLAFARVGFPVYDRVGYQRRAIIEYGGGINDCRSDHQHDFGSCGRVTWRVCKRVFCYCVCEGGVSEVVFIFW